MKILVHLQICISVSLTLMLKLSIMFIKVFLMALTYIFYTCKGKKNEKLKKSISQETKGQMK